MNRIAILVAGADYSPKAYKGLKTGKEYVNGHNTIMDADIKKVKTYLQSETGGKWMDEEIKCFYTKDVILDSFEKALIDLFRRRFDYLLFYYVGHGVVDRNGHEAMQFLIDENSVSKEFFVEELKTCIWWGKTDTYLAIMNCCRSPNEPIPNIQMPHEQVLAEQFKLLKVASSNYLNEIEKNFGTKAIVYATEKEAKSLFSDHGGSFFTNSFLKAVMKWGKNQSAGSVYTISEAIADTNVIMRIQVPNYNQIAEISGKGISIPIAVK